MASIAARECDRGYNDAGLMIALQELGSESAFYSSFNKADSDEC